MTLEKLKENRNQVIEIITDMIGSDNLKEGMNIVAKMIGFRGYEGYSVERFVKSAIKDSGIEDRIVMTNGVNAQARLEQMNIEASKKLFRNI